MSKFFAGVLLIILIAGLAFGGYTLFSKYIFVGGQVEKMLGVMSEAQTADVSMSLSRFSKDENSSFLFGDVEIDGVVDFRVPEQPAYDLKISVAATPNLSAERAVFLVRQTRGQTFVNVYDAPSDFIAKLETQGIHRGEWNQVANSQQVIALFGESLSLPSASSKSSQSLRDAIKLGAWFVNPQATLTEIVHGKVSRIYTAEVNSEAVVGFGKLMFNLRDGGEPTGDDLAKIEASGEFWKNSRANLWIDQGNSELRRVIIQLVSGDQLDAEFENINSDVEILLPSEELSLPDAEEVGAARPVAESLSTDNSPVSSAAEFPIAGDSDGDGLTDDLETFYGSNALNPDTDGDGYLDGEEVSSGYNPVGDGDLFNFGLPTL